MNEEQKPRIPGFIESLDKMREVHIKKNEDYATTDNPFSNFDVSEYGLNLFRNPRDQAFVWPIFTKLARLATLLNSIRNPNNESIGDSLIDIANYCLLWKCDLDRRKFANKTIVLKTTASCYECGLNISDTIRYHTSNFPDIAFCSEDHRNLMLARNDLKPY